MNLSPKRIFNLLKKSATAWSDDSATTLAAALAYYTVFSIAPLLIIAVAVAGLVFGDQAANGQIHRQIAGLVGDAGGKVIESMMASARKPSSGILATIIGLAILIFGASGVFVQLQESLNTVWKAKPDKSAGIKAFLRHRFFSFTMVLAIGFILLVSLGLSAGITALGTFMTSMMPGWVILGHVINIVVSFGTITLLFGLIYKLLPDAEVQWKDVWLGAAVTSLLFGIGKFGIGLYLGKSSVASSYGAAGSMAIVLLWVYYSAQILLFGAEFTYVHSVERGNPDALKAKQVKAVEVAKDKMEEAKNAPPGKKDELVAEAHAKAKDAGVPPSTWLPQ